MDEKSKSILSVRNLKTYFLSGSGYVVKAVDDISLDIKRSCITAVVGQSGSGKSVTAMSILRLIDSPGHIIGGEILFEGTDLLKLSEKEKNKIYGNEISVIFQEPMSALNPVVKIKKQMMEIFTLHKNSMNMQKAEVYNICVNALKKVNLKEAEAIMEKYPFELSGGMCQRVMIAMAIVSGAKLLIADEPTTALDLTVQAVVLDELKRLKEEDGMSVMLITHDLGIVAQMADYVYVMHNGKIVESGDVFNIFDNPVHDYTKTLIGAAKAKERPVI
jgi:ABC-type dipeptide/oligopeptide/nickel transport system ATPase component